jgi:hypothetical protein
MKRTGAVRSTKMKSIDLSPLFAAYKGQWVALTDYTPNYKVICNGRSVKAVYEKAIKQGHVDPVIFMVSAQLTHAIF